MSRQIKNKNRVAKRSAIRRAAPFLAVFIVITCVAWIIPLRPTVSASERRELTKFPALSWEALADGSWFSQVGLWFSDTFPGRDTWLKGATTLEEAYGKTDVKIYNGGGKTGIQADEIPDPVTNNGSVTTPVDIPPAGGGSSSSGNSSEPPSDSSEENSGSSYSGGGTIFTPSPNDEPISRDDNGSGGEGQTGPVKPGHTDSGSSEDPGTASGQEPTSGQSGNNNNTDLTGTGGTTVDQNPGAAQDVNQFDSLLRLGDSAYEYYYFVSNYVDRYVEAVNTAAATLNVQIYDLLIPNSMGIMLSDEFQAEYGSSNQKKAMAYIYSVIDPSVIKIDIFDLLRSHNNEYIYFRTDHHWTALGAYYAYAAFCQASGKEMRALSTFEEKVYPGFIGTLYSAVGKPAAMKENPDTVYAYDPGAGFSMDYWINQSKVVTDSTVLVDGNELGATDKYMTFIHGDRPLSIVYNNNLNDGSKILVLKESYGNCFIPFLAASYQTVIAVDYRSLDWMSLKELVEYFHVDSVLFLNNMTMTHSNGNTKQLLNFCSK